MPSAATFESFEAELNRLVAAFGARLGELKGPDYNEAKLRAATVESEKATLQNAVTATDRQIDELVYELYGLTPEEIALVENAA